MYCAASFAPGVPVRRPSSASEARYVMTCRKRSTLGAVVLGCCANATANVSVMIAGTKKNLRLIFTSEASYLDSATKIARIGFAFTKMNLFDWNRRSLRRRQDRFRRHYPQIYMPLLGITTIHYNDMI